MTRFSAAFRRNSVASPSSNAGSHNHWRRHRRRCKRLQGPESAPALRDTWAPPRGCRRRSRLITRCWHRDQFRRVPQHASPASGSPPHSRLPHRDSRTRHCCPPNSRTPSARPSDRRSGFQPTPPRIPQPDVSAWPMMAWSGSASHHGDSRPPHICLPIVPKPLNLSA